MIKTETIMINGRQFTRTYSDANMMIERGGARYSEAVDPVGSGRIYVETNEPLPTPGIEDEEPAILRQAVKILMGEADDELNW